MKRMHVLRISTLLAFLLVSGSSAQLFSQNANTGEINGTVTDTTGAVVPDVNVNITNVQTGVTSTVTTNSSGVYDAPTLLPGTYSLKFVKQGFTTFVRTNVNLGVQTIAIDAQLQVGAVSQQVTVTSATPLLQTQSSDSNTELASHEIANLPNASMSWYNFQDVLPGVAPGSTGYGGSSMSVNGTEPFSENWLINGSTDTFQANNNNPDIVGNVPMDSIAEVQAETNNFSAQYGNGPTVFNVITKSGTNKWHGSLFEFIQNTAFNARNYFSPKVSPTHWNQYGGTFGGPIKRDKAFFFFSFQQMKNNSSPGSYMTVPTAAMREGDFSDPAFPKIYDPASLNNGSRTALANNKIPSGEIDPVAANIEQYWPTPNVAGAGFYNNYFQNVVTNSKYTWYSGKVDYNLSSANRISGSLMFAPQDLPFTSITPYGWDEGHPLEQQESLQDSWTLGPAMVNQFTFGILRYGGHFVPPGLNQGLAKKVGILNPPADVFPHVSVGGPVGGTSIGGGADAFLYEGSYAPSDVLTILKGKHVIKIGGEYDRIYNNESAWGDMSSGNFSFSGIYTRNPSDSTSTGLGFADFLFGLPSSWNVTESKINYANSWSAGMFVDDTYKIMPKLTLNLGLRYGMMAGWSEAHNRIGTFDPRLTNPATNTLGAMWFGGQQGRTALERTAYNGIQPRIGFAWSPKNDWSIRGAYGIFDQNWAGAEYGSSGPEGLGWSATGSETSTDSVTPFFSLSPPSASLVAAYPSLVQGPPPPLQPTGTPSATFLNGQGVSYYPYNAPIPYVQQAHLDIQHQLPYDFFVDAGYVWTRGLHLPYWRDINQVPAGLLGPGNAQLNRPYPQYQGINANMEDGFSNYDALQVTVKRNFSRGFTFTANYTWSKALDTETVSDWYGTSSWIIQNSHNPRANYGLGDLDMPQIFNGYLIYELPFGRGRRFATQNPALNYVVGGWQISSIFQAHSGTSFTPLMGTGNLTGSLAGQWYPNRVPGKSGKLSHPTIHEWFDPTAFAQPAPYTFGNSGRNVLSGPGYKNVDLSVLRNFPIHKMGEQGGLDFRADAIDVFNHPNFNNPNQYIGTSGVGIISSASTSRSLQLSLALRF